MRIKHRANHRKMRNIKWGRALATADSAGDIHRAGLGNPTYGKGICCQPNPNRSESHDSAGCFGGFKEEDGLRYQSFVSLQQNLNGETTALTTDTVLINRLQGELLEKILQTLQQYREVKLELPLGSLSGVQFLAGSGTAGDAAKLRPVGLVKTKIINQFDEAGINQTRHRIQLQVTVDMLSLLPGYRMSSQAQSNIILAETIIVGLVPDAYTEVYGGTDRFGRNDTGLRGICRLKNKGKKYCI